MLRLSPALLVSAALAGVVYASSASSQTAPPKETLARLPVREVTVFKDGHSFVLHEGSLPTSGDGNILLDNLPTPVLGTFWPYSTQAGARLTAVTASVRRLPVLRTALTLRELIEGNEGAQVLVKESGVEYSATIIGVPTRSAEELVATTHGETEALLPQKADLVLLKTSRGTKAVMIDRIQDLTFKDLHRPLTSNQELRHLLTMQLDWEGKKPTATASVGMAYLQKGLRWIPNYRISLDGAGKANVRLQATLINELTDLKDVTCNLVVGVPTFAFQGMNDPIGLQQTVAQLSGYFQQQSRTGLAFSNSIMTQTAAETRGGGFGNPAPNPADLGPEIGGAGRSEDLFVFNVKHVTLKRGQRMVLPVAQYELPYKDLFVLDLPFGPPREVRGNLNPSDQSEIARLANRPTAMHKIRLTNNGSHPLTTAPALLVSGDRVLAQGLMTHTPVGANTDVPITPAVDIRNRRTDVEVERKPDAVVIDGDHLTRITYQGTIHLHNLRPEQTELEVTRYVLGQVTAADHDGVINALDPLDDDLGGFARPSWWNNFNWPSWWSKYNPITRITWRLRLEPKQELDLGYRWQYIAP
jgi:hypothetical protein